VGLFLLVVCLVIIVLGGLVLLGGFTSARHSDSPVSVPSNQGSTTENSQTSSPQVPTAQLPVDQSALNQKIFIPEVELLGNITSKLEGSNWRSSDSPLGISTSDLDQSLLNKAIEHELSKETRLKIPAEFEYLFIGGQAQSEITAVLSSAYDEYLEFLAEQNVKQAYIQEFKTRVLPNTPNRITYTASNQPSLPSLVEKYSGSGGDYGQLMASFTARHLYNEFNTNSKSGIFGSSLSDPKVAKSYRDLGIRFVAYHEYTHALQRAHANLNLPAGESSRKSYVDSLLNNGKSLMRADDERWRLSWGPSYLNNLHNQVVSEERQSDSIGFAALLDRYSFDAQVAGALKSRMFGRLDTARDIVNSSLPRLNKQNPEQDLGSFGSLLVKQMQISYPAGSKERKVLTDMLFRLDGLPAYVGYLNIMSEQELDRLWNLLQE
jgi:hypothetical protein